MSAKEDTYVCSVSHISVAIRCLLATTFWRSSVFEGEAQANGDFTALKLDLLPEAYLDWTAFAEEECCLFTVHSLRMADSCLSLFTGELASSSRVPRYMFSTSKPGVHVWWVVHHNNKNSRVAAAMSTRSILTLQVGQCGNQSTGLVSALLPVQLAQSFGRGFARNMVSSPMGT
jgi:hypothetical protein